MKFTGIKPNKKWLNVISVILIAVVIFSFIYTGSLFSNQSQSAMYPSVEFRGLVKVGDTYWVPYQKGVHIPANQGDVTLKGHFELVASDTKEVLGRPTEGTYVAFYFNHISGKISEDGGEMRSLDAELDIAGEDMCGVMYIGYVCEGGEEITITLHNPHKFGNGNAIDEFLDNLNIYGGTNFEKDMLDRGNVQRNIGIVLVLSAFMILGTAILSLLINMKGNKDLTLIGLGVLFAGIYFIFSAHGVMFFSEIIKFNTRMLGASMILYMLSVTLFLISQFKGKLKKVGKTLTFLSVLSTLIFLITPMVADIKFYDVLFPWATVQSLICLVMTVALAYQFSTGGENNEILCAFGMLPMIAFLIDVAGNLFELWQGGFVSGIVFIVLFVVALVLLIKIIPKNITDAMRARDLEAEQKILKAELAESRIATMISQIQPHFIYNTLGTIEQLCLTDPESASRLVRNFSLYLRGNFSELDNAKPIRFSQEMNHVKHYTDIEQVRFPDMTIQYDLRSVEFVLPALSVQPLVENAIKHGLMGLEEGGIVTISAYETEKDYIVEVKDDGIGFDTNLAYDDKKHVGIKNIRGRIEAMCNGSLTIESTPGKGTVATIKIPKEVCDDRHNS